MTPEPHLRGHVAFHAASASRERGRPDVRIVGELAHVTYRRPSARRNGGRPADPPSVPPRAAFYSAISSSTVTAQANGAFQLIAISLVDHDSM